MNHVMAYISTRTKKKFFKLISNEKLFEPLDIDINACVLYSTDHNLDEDSWFKIENFSQKNFCLYILKNDFDSKDYDNLSREQFPKISYLFSVQAEDFYFQRITPSLFINRKMITFGDIGVLEKVQNRLVIHSLPDAVYLKKADTLIFKNLSMIASIFKGIDELLKEATDDEIKSFFNESFIELCDDFNSNKISKPNKKRISLDIKVLENMSLEDKNNMCAYINSYCNDKIIYDKDNIKFKISTDLQLKLLIYGITERFYTTPIGNEKLCANSVTTMD